MQYSEVQYCETIFQVRYKFLEEKNIAGRGGGGTIFQEECNIPTWETFWKWGSFPVR